jgi:hypothetical protein
MAANNPAKLKAGIPRRFFFYMWGGLHRLGWHGRSRLERSSISRATTK